MADHQHTTRRAAAKACPFDFDERAMDFNQLSALLDALAAAREIFAATSVQSRCIARQSPFGIMEHTAAGNLLAAMEEACDAAVSRIEDEAWRREYRADAEDADAHFKIAMAGYLSDGPKLAAAKMVELVGARAA